jgi:hypothetical protein
MAFSDDEQQIAEDRALLDWAREAPTSPGDYDHAPSEEEAAAHDYERRKWLERKPNVRSGYDR